MTARMVFLNGPPSVGKSSIARSLQLCLDEPFFRLDLDEFLRGYSPRWWTTAPGQQLFPMVVNAWLLALRDLGRTGNSVIAPTMIASTLGNVERHVELFAEFTVYLVGVTCPLELAQQRERSRDDRDHPLDLNVPLYRALHRELDLASAYDLQIDTSTMTSKEAASQVIALLRDVANPQAFARIARQATPRPQRQPDPG